jgi:hypothetical protein
MLNKTALCLAVLLGATSAAAAATKQVAHRHQTGVVRHVPAAAYQSFGSALGARQVPTAAYQNIASVRGAEQVHEPRYMSFQEQELTTGD